jgi:histone deacetylase complex regulatory component SIN3
MLWSTSAHDAASPSNPSLPARNGSSTPMALQPVAGTLPLPLAPSMSASAPPTRRSSRDPDGTNDHASAFKRGEEGQAIEPAVQYVQKIKQRCDAETYAQFLEILSSYHHKPETVDEVCSFSFTPHGGARFCLFILDHVQREVAAQVSRLFKDAPDLRSDFRIFMPDEHAQLFDDPEEGPRTRTPANDNRSRRRDNGTPTVPQKRKRKEKETVSNRSASSLRVSCSFSCICASVQMLIHASCRERNHLMH